MFDTVTAFELCAQRCDHCGRPGHQFYTLFEMANGHPHEEDVAICAECCGSGSGDNWTQRFSPSYWEAWLNLHFHAEVQS